MARLGSICDQFERTSLNELIHHACIGSNKTIRDAIVDAILTHETSFFRTPPLFQALANNVLPQLLANSNKQTIHIWSAACSYGQEPYSVAMLVHDRIAKLNQKRICILGSDISQLAIDRAKAGVFSQLEVNRGLPATSLMQHFNVDGRNFCIKEPLRKSVSFRPINLATALPPLPLCHVILLRNTLLYLSPKIRNEVLQRVRVQLARGGLIAIGSTETIPHDAQGLLRVEIDGYPFYTLQESPYDEC